MARGCKRAHSATSTIFSRALFDSCGPPTTLSGRSIWETRRSSRFCGSPSSSSRSLGRARSSYACRCRPTTRASESPRSRSHGRRSTGSPRFDSRPACGGHASISRAFSCSLRGGCTSGNYTSRSCRAPCRREYVQLANSVLVTGGAGYIGSHTCKALAQAGYVPVTLDNLVCGHREAVRWGPFVRGDIADRALVRRLLREHHISAVMHFAGYAYVGESMRAPGKYFDNNVCNTAAVLESMHAEGIGRIVFSSTCATYGVPRSIPIDETH